MFLVEEIRQPQHLRQPEITLTVSPTTTRSAEIRISGQGVNSPSSIGVVCFPNTWWPLDRTTHSETPERSSTTYEVGNEASEEILKAQSCYVAVAGLALPVPLDLLSVAWGRKP